MHSYTSNSDQTPPNASPAGATDYVTHRESASPSTGHALLVRPVPQQPWLRHLIVAAFGVAALVGGWEYLMRDKAGLRAGDLGDSRADWIAQRRLVDSAPKDSIVIIGDSRILFDTDLDTWQALTGRRPFQLGLMGAGALPVLDDFANDPHFTGLLVIGTAEFSYFAEGPDSATDALDHRNRQSPSERLGNWLQAGLSRHFAFIDVDYTLMNIIERYRWPEREHVGGSYYTIWKLAENLEGRQTHLWDRLAADPYLLEHAQTMWKLIYNGDPIPEDLVARVVARTKIDIDKIRARGGDVVWVRPPSAGPILDIERKRYPRDRAWDRLLRETGTLGVYFDDYPQMRGLTVPDWSHLDQASSLKFTDAYVRVLSERVNWLKSHPIAQHETAEHRTGH
jgi:hypothetical protein